MSGFDGVFGQTVSALFGTLVGGAVTFFVTRWQLKKTITAEAALAADQRFADVQLARADREGVAARLLLERLADFYTWLPSLPDVGLDQPTVSSHARQQCSAAMESVRRGMYTELLVIRDREVRGRYRNLVRLAYDVGGRGIGRPHRKRQIRDVRGYLRYVQATLSAVIDAVDLPAAVEIPILDRAEHESWALPDLGPDWSDPADRS
jgi:DNA-binding transcriptional ArsR family regulator